jgi:hypothetical protein
MSAELEAVRPSRPQRVPEWSAAMRPISGSRTACWHWSCDLTAAGPIAP